MIQFYFYLSFNFKFEFDSRNKLNYILALIIVYFGEIFSLIHVLFKLTEYFFILFLNYDFLKIIYISF